MRGRLLLFLVCAACGGSSADGVDSGPNVGLDGSAPLDWSAYGLGATFEPGRDYVRFQVRSQRATRIEVWLYDRPFADAPVATVVLNRALEPELWRARVDVSSFGGGPVYYGLRAWGPNWTHDPAWAPGSELGFVADVDAQGNRFNPNKLLIDPYARELSHDPTNPTNTDYSFYAVGPDHRTKDSGPVAPKSIVVDRLTPSVIARPAVALQDSIIYEVHLRGFTRNDPDAVDGCAGTYAAAGAKAPYLAELGVTAIELLPVAETNNDANDLVAGTAGDNYWGYSTLAFFAPDRRYACDRSPGGPTREFRDMVDAFHRAGVEVIVDVVYNHTAEGSGGALLSLRGLDNAGYYQLAGDNRRFANHNGVGANTSSTNPMWRDLVIDSLTYWHRELGVDGFRYDLAPILGNRCERDCFDFDRDDPNGLLRRIPAELPSAKHIAEPWAIGAGTYQIGNFPPGWAEWNDGFRDDLRTDQNRHQVQEVTPGWLANRIAGSWNRFGAGGRAPSASINFIVAHDGFTLRDLHSCNTKNNGQPWPYGPSDGGSDHNLSWDHGGDAVAQRQAVRTSLALLMLSAGTPMITGGDERFRTQYCNNNVYNLDSDKNWLDWVDGYGYDALHTFSQRLLQFRRAHAALRPGWYWQPGQVTWHQPSGEEADGSYMDDASHQFLAWRLDGQTLGDSARSIYVAYNGGAGEAIMYLPAPAPGHHWYRVADTATWMEPYDNIDAAGIEYQMQQQRYDMAARSLALFIER